MITEDYVSFEIAKLLKEKGFHEKVNHVYHSYTSSPFYRRHLQDFNGEDYKSLRHEHYSAPTLQMAMKYLKEVHNLFIEITVGETEGKTWYDYDIIPINGKVIYWKGLDVLPPVIECNTPEEAIEIGLKYCLEHLI